jgi:MSHA biogenesis protein MshP
MINKTGFRIQDSECHPQDRKGLPLEQEALKCLLLNEGVGQRGFSLVSAIFLLVVIAALGTFAVTLSTTQQQSAALDVLGARAYQASRAGIEWGAYQVINSPATLACATLPASAANGPIAMTSNLQPFSVMLYCGTIAASEAGATVTMYQLTSIAQQGAVATAGYVERQISVTIAQ